MMANRLLTLPFGGGAARAEPGMPPANQSASSRIERRAEKWKPVFRQNAATANE